MTSANASTASGRRAASAHMDGEIDEGIAPVVRLLQEHGVETFESCEGGPGHTLCEPTVRFHGQRDEGYRAVALLLQHGIPVASLRRYWSVIDGELVGPDWEVALRST